MDDNREVNTFCIVVSNQLPAFFGYLIHILFYAVADSRTGIPVLDVYTGAYWLEWSAKETTLFRNPVKQYLLIFIFCAIFATVYTTLIYFTYNFANVPGSEKPFWYAAFVIINLLYKAVLKGLGIFIDAGKSGTFSLFFCAELIILMFYYSFYRALFDTLGGSAESYFVFVGLQIIHVFHEWVFYPIRATAKYYTKYRSFVKSIGEYKSTILNALFAPLSLKLVFSYKDWASFVSLDYGLRCCAAIFTSITYVTYFTFLRYGWNRDHFNNYNTVDVDNSTYSNFVAYTICSTLVEIINTWVIEIYFLKPRKLMMVARLSRLFSNKNFMIASSLIIGGLFCNLFQVNSIMDFIY